MSKHEKFKHSAGSHEHLPQVEHLLPTAEQATPLHEGERDPAKAVEAARDELQEVEETIPQANPLEELQESEKAAKPAAPQHVSPELRQATLNRQLTAIRRNLSAPGRTFSKVIHQPVIRAVSEPAGKTVSRPSGLLGGGLVAFLGTTGYLYMAKHNGMAYSYFVFIGLFVGGFIVGLALELLIHMAAKPRHRASN